MQEVESALEVINNFKNSEAGAHLKNDLSGMTFEQLLQSSPMNIDYTQFQDVTEIETQTGEVVKLGMPPSTGRDINIFEEEATRNSAGSETNVPAGQRLFNDPNPGTSESSQNYIVQNSEQLGIDYSSPTPVTKINENNSIEIADAYDAMNNDPNNPTVKQAYNDLTKEVGMQYDQLVKDGIEVEIWEGKGEPYANSDEMVKDVRDNKHLYIFSTLEGFGETQISEKLWRTILY